MNQLEFIAAIIQSITWPLIVLLSIFILRKQLDHLIDLIHTIKFKGVEVALGKEVRLIREQVSSTQYSKESLQFLTVRLPDNLIQLANVSTRAVVVEAWKELQQAILVTVNKQGIKLPNIPYQDYPAIAEQLEKTAKLNLSFSLPRIVSRLQALFVTFTSDFDKQIPADIALEYADICFQIAANMRTSAM